MIGMMSMSGSLDMMTPAACTPHWRFRPSMPLASSTTRCASGSAAWICRNSSASLYRLSSGLKMPVREMSLPMIAGGMALVSFSPIANGKPRRREESLSACLALMVPYVTIWATRSSPYFSVTYRMTSPRRRSSKSTSKSGMDTRSGLRKRSKIRPCCSGSRSVMRMA